MKYYAHVRERITAIPVDLKGFHRILKRKKSKNSVYDSIFVK